MQFTAKDVRVVGGIMSAKDPLGRVIEFDGPASSVITTICCSCKKITKITDGVGNFGDSHGYCEPCGIEMREQLMAQIAV